MPTVVQFGCQKTNPVLGCIKKLRGRGGRWKGETWVPAAHAASTVLRLPTSSYTISPSLLSHNGTPQSQGHTNRFMWFSLLFHSSVQAINSLWCHLGLSLCSPFPLLSHCLNNSPCLSLVTISRWLRLRQFMTTFLLLRASTIFKRHHVMKFYFSK